MFNQIVFLGAGASAAEGAPIQGNLFEEFYFEYRKGRDLRIKKIVEPHLKQFFNSFFNIDFDKDLKNISFPTFEEVLGMIEMAIDRQENFVGFKSMGSQPNLYWIKENLIFLIAVILDIKLKRPVEHHKKLISRLVKENKLRKTAFISLNYDILIDNALVDQYTDYHLDYGVEFVNFFKKGDWVIPNPQKAIYLLKPHGSLNWLYCPTCILMELTPKEKGAAQLVFEPKECTKCGCNMSPIIIPPTFKKIMTNIYLQETWRLMEKIMKETKSIVFCGYSFPDADLHIKYLLKRVELLQNGSPIIYVVNSHTGKSELQKTDENNRYKRIMKDSSKLIYTDMSFEEFSAEGI